MNRAVDDGTGRTWLTDNAVGFISRFGEDSECKLLEIAFAAGLAVECVPGGRGESRLADFDAHVVVESFGSRAGGDAVFVRMCPETGALIDLLARLEREPSIEALSGLPPEDGGTAGPAA